MPVGVAERFAGGAADDGIRSLYRAVQWEPILLGKRFVNIPVNDVHTDVLTIGLAGTGVVVDGILDTEPLVLEKRPVEDACPREQRHYRIHIRQVFLNRRDIQRFCAGREVFVQCDLRPLQDTGCRIAVADAHDLPGMSQKRSRKLQDDRVLRFT